MSINPFSRSKRQGPIQLSKQFIEKFRRMEIKRERVNTIVNKLKWAVISGKKNQKALYQNLLVAISEYQFSKKNILEVYQKYMALPPKEKKIYWERFCGRESQEVTELFGKMMDLQHAEGNALMDTLDTDTFLAFHLSNGRVLIKNFIEYIEFYKTSLNIQSNNYIQIQPIPKDGYTVHDISAKTGWDVSARDHEPYRLSPEAFFKTVQENMQLGKPELLDTIILQYAEQGSVPFGDTIENGVVQHYMIETYITYLHEMGHALAILRGDFFDPGKEPFLPENLAVRYHSLEEFLNIVARDVSENKLDAVGIQRFGHTGIEKASLDKLDFDELVYHLQREIDEECIQEDINTNKLIQQGTIRWDPPSRFVEKKSIQEDERIEHTLSQKEEVARESFRQASISDLFKLKSAGVDKTFKLSSHSVGQLLLSSLNEEDKAEILKDEKQEALDERLFDEMLSTMEIEGNPYIAPSLEESLNQSILISSSRNQETDDVFGDYDNILIYPLPDEKMVSLITKYKNDPDEKLSQEMPLTQGIIFNKLNDICIHGMTQEKINHLKDIGSDNQLGKLDYLLEALELSLNEKLSPKNR